MTSMPYFALYPSDFMADVGHLGNTELGIYWRLLLVYYKDARPLPFDVDRLRRLAMTFSPEECRALEAVMAEFFALTTEPDGASVWRHKRADKELGKAASTYANRVRGVGVARAAKAKISDIKPEIKADIKPDFSLISTGEPEPEPEPEEIQSQLSLAPAFPAENQPQLPANEEKPAGIPDCPHLAVLALWAQVLPEMPQHNAGMWNSARAAHLRARWRETAAAECWTSAEQGLDYLRRLFTYVGQSAFLTGRTASAPGKRPFFIELEWLVNPSNWAKVHEGKYHPENTK